MTIEVRDFEIREVNEEERSVTGIAVPFDQTITVGGIKERFERGAFADDVEATLFYGHDHRSGGLPIGKVVGAKNTDSGFVIRAKLSKTPKADEVYQLVKDGVLTKFSVGFEPVEDRMEKDVVVRTKANLKEVSVVAMPAYSDASITSVRETETAHEGITSNKEDINMSNENTAPEMAELREAVSVLERKVEGLNVVEETAPSAPEFRSFGEYAKAVSKGTDEAENIYRAYTGGTTADVAYKDNWQGNAIRLLDKGRPVINAFTKAVLPAEGMTITHGVLNTNTLTVGKQVNEGDPLPFGKVTVTTAQASVNTYGGYTTLSRQEIERSTVDILDVAFRGMALEYAKQTEAAVRTVVTGASGTATATLTGGDTAAAHLGLLADAAGALDDEGWTLDFILVSKDVFKRLAVLVGSDGRPLLSYGNGVNTIGGVNVPNLTANINGVPVVRNGNLATNTYIAGNKNAVKVWESTGAPFTLGPDQDIKALSNDYSVYGYLASAVEFPKALVKATVTVA